MLVSGGGNGGGRGGGGVSSSFSQEIQIRPLLTLLSSLDLLSPRSVFLFDLALVL
jgi:hypothetical protein